MDNTSETTLKQEFVALSTGNPLDAEDSVPSLNYLGYVRNIAHALYGKPGIITSIGNNISVILVDAKDMGDYIQLYWHLAQRIIQKDLSSLHDSIPTPIGANEPESIRLFLETYIDVEEQAGFVDTQLTAAYELIRNNIKYKSEVYTDSYFEDEKDVLGHQDIPVDYTEWVSNFDTADNILIDSIGRKHGFAWMR